jgi:Transcriptional regulators
MNIYDIAKESGVSIATVSRVLNNKTNVRPATKAKIEAVLKKHNYIPNDSARGLATKTLKTIGILTIDLRVPQYASTVYALERELYKCGYNVTVCNTGGQTDNNVHYLHILRSRGIGGIILIGSVFDDKYVHSSIMNEMLDIPIIIINSTISSNNSYSIMLDHEKGMELCLSHLMEKGHKNILYVQDTYSTAGQEKARSFLMQCKTLGLSSGISQTIYKTERSIEGGQAVASQIIEDTPDFSAVIFGSDLTAVSAANYFQLNGYRIPEDIAVIGWNNTLFSELSRPSLTSLDTKTELVGMFTAKLLENIVSGQQSTRTLSISPELIIRQST